MEKISKLRCIRTFMDNALFVLVILDVIAVGVMIISLISGNNPILPISRIQAVSVAILFLIISIVSFSILEIIEAKLLIELKVELGKLSLRCIHDIEIEVYEMPEKKEKSCYVVVPSCKEEISEEKINTFILEVKDLSKSIKIPLRVNKLKLNVKG